MTLLMIQRPITTGIVFAAMMIYWLSPHSMFSTGENFLALAQSTPLDTEPHPHQLPYKEQLSNRQTASARARLWRKHRSYPHLDKALRLIKADRCDEALEVYDHYLEADPNHRLMRWSRLILVSKTAPPDTVIHAATDFLNRVPGFGPALMIRAFAHHNNKWFEAAEKDFESARRYKLLLDKDRKKVLAQLYLLAYQRDDFLRSKNIARQLIDEYPDNAIFRENYAQALYRLGDLPKSEKQWQKVQTLTADNIHLRRAALSRMTILIQLGQYSSGDRILKEVQHKNLFNPSIAPLPDYLDYLRLKATLSQKQGRAGIAKSSFEQALSFLADSGNTLSGNDLSQAYQSVGDAAFDANFLSLALKAYTHSLTNGNDPRIRVKASETAWQLEEYDRTAGLLHPLVFGDEAPAAAISAKIAQRLCLAYAKQGLDKQAAACFDKLVPIYSQNADLLLEAAQAAGRTGRVQRQVDLLQRCFDLQPSSDKALSIGYLYTEMEQHKSANHWFQLAYQSTPTVESGLAYVNGLLVGRDIDGALSVLGTILQSNSLSPDQMENTYGALGTAYMQQNHFDKAVDTWYKALEVSSDPAWNIYRAQALRKSNRLKSAEVLFSTIPVALLPPKDQLAWYDEAGELFHQTGRLAESLAALREAAIMDSTYQRQLSLSMLLLEMDRLPEAEQSVDHALTHKPDDIVAQRHKAYVLAAKGDDKEAVKYMKKINEILPEDYETLHSLGLLYLKLGSYDASIKAFRGAIDATKISEHGETVIPMNRLQDLKATQNQMVELNRRFHYALSQSVHIGQNEGRSQGVHLSDNGFTQAFGAVEVAYRPLYTGYRSGRIHEFYSSALWTNNDDSHSDNGASNQGRLGLRIKPFDAANIVVATESVFFGDDDKAPNILMRMSHSFSRKLWHNGRESHPLFGPNLYLHTYAEVGKAFLNEAEFFGNLQARIGRSVETNGKLFLSPFVYILANGYNNEYDGDTHGQAGIGLAFDLFSGYHRYRGYRRHTEILMRLGLDFDRDGENRELNGLISLGFSFF